MTPTTPAIDPAAPSVPLSAAAPLPERPDPRLFEREPDDLPPLSDETKAGLADERWIEDELLAGRLREYTGKNIAVVDRQVVGVGDSPLALMYEVADRLHVLPCRVAVSYVG